MCSSRDHSVLLRKGWHSTPLSTQRASGHDERVDAIGCRPLEQHRSAHRWSHKRKLTELT
ncbi:hypothetical protein ACRRTK_021827 [Alexandromys fortis]